MTHLSEISFHFLQCIVSASQGLLIDSKDSNLSGHVRQSTSHLHLILWQCVNQSLHIKHITYQDNGYNILASAIRHGSQYTFTKTKFLTVLHNFFMWKDLHRFAVEITVNRIYSLFIPENDTSVKAVNYQKWIHSSLPNVQSWIYYSSVV